MAENKDIQHFVDDLRREYFQVLPEKIATIEGMLLAHERSRKQLDMRVLREVHGIKGAAGTFGFAIASTICNQFEDDLNGFVERGGVGEAGETEHLLKYVDFLREAVEIAVDASISEEEREQRWQLVVLELRSHSGLEKARIFVVDNSRITFGIIERGLVGKQVSISFCSDGYEALGRLLREDFDLVVVGKSVRGLCGPSLIAATRMNRPKAPLFLMLSSDKYVPQVIEDAPDVVVLRDKNMAKSLSAAAIAMVERN